MNNIEIYVPRSKDFVIEDSPNDKEEYPFKYSMMSEIIKFVGFVLLIVIVYNLSIHDIKFRIFG